jgi:hypothetical protein
MLEDSHDAEEIIARVAALDIGKAELVCCVRVPGPDGAGRRLHEVSTYSTMTRSPGADARRLTSIFGLGPWRADGADAPPGHSRRSDVELDVCG